MTAIRSAAIFCDGPRCEFWLDAAGGAAAFVEGTVERARQVARDRGWHRRPDGRDICPDCWEEGAR